MTRVYSVLGWPVAHSRSPAMHNAAFAALGVDATYVRFPVAPDALADALRGLRALGIAGANVTIPHKSAVLPLLDAVDDAARAIGAVNTIVRDADGRLRGTNTDAGGLVSALREAGARLDGANALVLGAGGAARAAVYGLAQAGASVSIAARRAEAARALGAMTHGVRSAVSTLTLGALPVVSTLTLGDATALRAAFARADLVVQATSATLHVDGDDAAARAFVAALPLDALHSGALVTDLVYAPRQTALLTAAGAHGAQTLDGTAMLLHQGALAFTQWTGLEAPLAVMRAALDATS